MNNGVTIEDTNELAAVVKWPIDFIRPFRPGKQNCS
jgi:hypothetical protein